MKGEFCFFIFLRKKLFISWLNQLESVKGPRQIHREVESRKYVVFSLVIIKAAQHNKTPGVASGRPPTKQHKLDFSCPTSAGSGRLTELMDGWR